jgi:hypothetical protein
MSAKVNHRTSRYSKVAEHGLSVAAVVEAFLVRDEVKCWDSELAGGVPAMLFGNEEIMFALIVACIWFSGRRVHVLYLEGKTIAGFQTKTATCCSFRYSCKSFGLQVVCKELKAVVNRVGLEPTTR